MPTDITAPATAADPATAHPDPTTLDAINKAAEARHDADRAWFLSRRDLWADHQAQVVAVYDREVLGRGPGYVAAHEDARRKCAAEGRECPGPYDLTLIVVPYVLDPDGPPDWDPWEQVGV